MPTFRCAACGHTEAHLDPFEEHARAAHQGVPLSKLLTVAPAPPAPITRPAHCAGCAAEMTPIPGHLQTCPACATKKLAREQGDRVAPANLMGDGPQPQPTSPEGAPMKLTVLIDGGNSGKWMEIHKTGCADLNKFRHSDNHGLKWVEEHATKTEAAESFASDFIAEGSMTLADALADMHFAPCVTIPLETPKEITAMPETTTAPTTDEMRAALKASGTPGHLSRMKVAEIRALFAGLKIDSDSAGDLAPPAPEAPAAPAAGKTPNLRTARIPADASEHACSTCGETKDRSAFPTVTGPADRTTECRKCRNARRPEKATNGNGSKPAKAGASGLDPATAPYGIGGDTKAAVDRAYSAAYEAAKAEDGKVPAEVAAALLDAQAAAIKPLKSTAKKA